MPKAKVKPQASERERVLTEAVLAAAGELNLWDKDLAAVLGVFLCDRASDSLGVHDHPGIVWDEFVGLWIALWALPPEPLWIALGFVVFRVLDIAKPWPVGWLDRHTRGGLGIMVDDVAAGVMTCVTLHLALSGMEVL